MTGCTCRLAVNTWCGGLGDIACSFHQVVGALVDHKGANVASVHITRGGLVGVKVSASTGGYVSASLLALAGGGQPNLGPAILASLAI